MSFLRLGSLLVCAGAAALATATATAQPQDAAPTAEALRDAAAAFRDGEKAFAARDYARAASRFAEANRLAPHPNALWNEARALLRAGDKPAAAVAFSHYLRVAPPDAQDRAEATRTLDTLAKDLLRLDVVATGFDTVLVDDQRIEPGTVYVEPGRHAVEGHAGARVVREDATGKAGEILPVTITAPASVPVPVPVTAPVTAPVTVPVTGSGSVTGPATATLAGTAPQAAASSGWSPVVFYISGGASILVLGAAVASGVDTLNYKAAYQDASASQQVADYPTGVSKMQRTNVLLAVGGVGAVFTAVVGLALVDWHGGGGATVGVGPGSIELRGAFR